MNYIYDIPEDWKGFSADSFLEPEKLKDKIIRLAVTNPSSYIGITNDGRLEFKGCAIEIIPSWGSFSSTLMVQFHSGPQKIHQAFWRFWMKLYDEKIVLGEPSERVEKKEDKGESKKKIGAPHKDDDVWAWKQIWMDGRDTDEVKQEWIAKLFEHKSKRPIPVDLNSQWRAIREFDWFEGKKSRKNN